MWSIVTNDLPNNALLGVTADVNTRIYATVGVHAGRVTTLDPTANLAVGSVVANRANIPTVTDWQYGFYYGATVDLEAAVLLLKTVVTGVGGSAK